MQQGLKGPKVISLIRVSTDEQAKEGKAGIPRQDADIEALKRSHGLEVVRRAEIIDVSGTDVLKHPEFQRIFRELAGGDIDGVACSALDRLVRPNMGSDFGVFDAFQIHRKKIWTAAQGLLDPATDMGFMMALMFGGQAALEWRELRRRSMGGKERLRKEGRLVVGPQCLPRGLRYVKGLDGKPGHWEYTEPWASRVRRAYDLLFEGWSYCAIAREIGFGTDAGVRLYLRNPVWKGVRIYSFERGGSKRYSEETGKPWRETTLRNEPVMVSLGIEPLISPERWQAAQELMLRRAKEWSKHHKPINTSNFLVLGILRCTCGYKHYMHRDHRRGEPGDVYYCSSRARGKTCESGSHQIRRDHVDRTVEKIVIQRLADPAFVTEVVTGLYRQAQKTDGARKTARELEALRKRRNRICDMREDGSISKEDFARRIRTVDDEIRVLEHRLPQEAARPQAGVRDLAKQIIHAFAEFEFWPYRQKRSFLRKAVKEIILDGREIPTLTLSGGFLAGLAGTDSRTHSWTPTGNSASPSDLTIHFPEPIGVLQ